MLFPGYSDLTHQSNDPPYREKCNLTKCMTMAWCSTGNCGCAYAATFQANEGMNGSIALGAPYKVLLFVVSGIFCNDDIPARTCLVGQGPSCLRRRLQSVEWPLHLPLHHPC